MALRRARVGAGTSERVARERGTEYEGVAIDKYIAGIPYVVVGGLATRIYMQERATLDTDILVETADLQAAESRLRESACRKEGLLSIGGSTWTTPGGRILDVIALEEPWVEDAIANPVAGPGDLPFIALPYLVVMKLFSGRLQDLADISRMLGGATEDEIDSVTSTIRRYRPRDEDDLNSVIQLGRLEYGAGSSGK